MSNNKKARKPEVDGWHTRVWNACFVFEGHDGAGEGGTIKATTERGESSGYAGVHLDVRLRL